MPTELRRPKPFTRGEKGHIDLVAVEAIIKAKNLPSISKQMPLVRTIPASLLLTDDDSYGLPWRHLVLLEKLSCFNGRSVAILVDAERTGAGLMNEEPRETRRFFDKDGLDGNASRSTVACHDAEPTRGQTHPLVLTVLTARIFCVYRVQFAHHSLASRHALTAHQGRKLLGCMHPSALSPPCASSRASSPLIASLFK
ncbi:hypothetical protein FIBSPDRAFT_965787 [Athelia psychrophila]|uniref:Uncharacterized protein n=1 Tax=Athelia psychrophila TaxID=1759441 RepID=A0A167XHY2_9AGAM|nr:hypothetical protein FIBSPDRAFT_965787 [Fibularhizoctonia sp. CBS 109695]